MSEQEEEVAGATEWLARQLDHVQFGDLGVKFVIHAGRVVRVERTITEKAQPVERPTDGGTA